MAAVLPSLSQGAIQALKQEEGYSQPCIFKVKSVVPNPKDESRFKVVFTDGGAAEINGMLASQLSPLARDGKLKASSIVKVTGYSTNTTPAGIVLLVTELEVLVESSSSAGDGPGPMDASVAVKLSTPAVKGAGPAKPAPSPLFTPSMVKQQPQEGATPQLGPTPPSAAPASISKRTSGFCHISDLHPYDDQWKLRAKVARKYPLRTTSKANSSVMTVELVDDEGGQIQATFWRAQAERWSVALEEGKVYVFERFQVKPANKQFSSVRNDYEITILDRSEVGEAADQQVGAAMTAAVEHVPLDQLPKHITRKAPVDVLAVVVSVGGSSTVKRKSDSSEVARRDITLADRSGKSVVLTVWGDNVDKAAQLEGQEGAAVIECTACRVTDFNGCSLSTLSRSQLSLQPDTPAAHALQQWWQQEGSTLTLTPVGGEAAAAGRGSGGAGGAGRALSTVQEVSSQPMPEPDAKGVYHNLVCTLVFINPSQALYYLANPKTNKKVVERDGRYYCEADGSYCDDASHRYMLAVKVQDMTGEAWLSCFNEQAEQLLGCSADELAALKAAGDEDAYTAKLKAAQWKDVSLSVLTRTREFQGERKLRHSAVATKPLSYAAEAARLAELIAKYN